MNVIVRNPKVAHARTVIAGEALNVGEVVVMVQGTAIGEPPQVRKPTVAELGDATVVKGIVTFVPDNDLAVGFILDPADEGLSQNTGSDNVHVIASGKHCVMWYGKPVIGFSQAAVTAALTVSSTREGAKVAFIAATGKLAAYNAAGTDGTQHYKGTVYMNEGAEITVLFDAL